MGLQGRQLARQQQAAVILPYRLPAAALPPQASDMRAA